MNDEQLLRYSRQIMLPDVGIEGQQRLLDSRALIIGLGGLGSPVAMYLAAAGVGQLVMTDFDNVDLSNLQRQILHQTRDVGRAKTESARESLEALNPDIQITLLPGPLADDALDEQVAAADIVLDCTDNFAARFQINRACVQQHTPLVSGAVIRMEGQVSIFAADDDSPCYRCLYRDENEPQESCSETGILAPVAGIIGSVQATEALKCLLQSGENLSGRLLLLDASLMQWREVRLKKDPHCPVCGKP
jgi:molybdopterin/thiamine biosynthesis adenylyltransferase